MNHEIIDSHLGFLCKMHINDVLRRSAIIPSEAFATLSGLSDVSYYLLTLLMGRTPVVKVLWDQR